MSALGGVEPVRARLFSVQTKHHIFGPMQHVSWRYGNLTSSQKGAVAEAAIAASVIQLGLTVLRPLCEGRRYDLMVDLEPAVLRVQYKLARRVRGVLAVNLQTCRHTPRGYIRTSYSASEIDAVAIYSAELNRSFLLPVAEVAGMRDVSSAWRRLETIRPTASGGQATTSSSR